MRWFFQPHSDGHGSGQHAEDSAPGLISLPAALLQRHGALALDPGTAASIPGGTAPRPTVYRAKTLLVPDDLLNSEPVTRALAGVGMRLSRADREGGLGGGGRGEYQEVLDKLRRLPRPAVLTPVEGRPPVVIDAWVALQALRAAASTHKSGERDEAAAERISQSDVKRISLEHLLISSPPPHPIDGGGGGLNGTTDGSSGVTGPSSTSSYVYNGDTRTPVAVCLDAPAREPIRRLRSVFGRRPVVAVLDNGVRAHPWLDVSKNANGGYETEPEDRDGFVMVDYHIQEAIRAEGDLLEKDGDRPRQVIRKPWDTPVTADPLIDELDTDTGHGTFIAGIVRQVAPDVRVLAVRVMHSDGVVYEGDLICALSQLALRIARAEQGYPAEMVDLISLSLGYFNESPSDEDFSSGLWQVLEVLLDLGVIVVAAAGNYSTSRRFYPAAFAPRIAAGRVPVISVGALNPNGSAAVFSDGGHWITAWASGAAVVSTFPTDINGSRSAELQLPAHPDYRKPPRGSLPGGRQALDPDDYSDGFAVWSGTSFSAPVVAAHIARELLKKKTDPERGLNLPGRSSAANRALAALKDLGWKADRCG